MFLHSIPGVGDLYHRYRRLILDICEYCDIVLMDQYRYENAVLERSSLREQKGESETFDAKGLNSLFARLRQNKIAQIAIPVFDRRLEILRNAGRIIPQ